MRLGSPVRIDPAAVLINMQYELELHKKAWGMEASANANESLVSRAREHALFLARMNGEVSIDDVRDSMPGVEFGNWAGSVFKSKDFVFTGKWLASRHKGSHARPVRVWQLSTNNS